MTLKLDGIKDLPEVLSPTVELVDLPDSGCKWPYEGLMCCGRPRLKNRPYCQDHDLRVHPQKSGRGMDLDAQARLNSFRKAKPRPQVTLMIEDIG